MMYRVSSSAAPADVARLAASMAREAAADPRTRMLALQAVRKFWRPRGSLIRPVLSDRRPFQKGDDAARYVAALGRWAQSIALVREPIAVAEVVQAPWRTVAYQAGDCDDLACAVAAFAAVVGLPAAVAVYEVSPGFAHMVALVGDSWNPDDAGRLTHMIDHDGARVAPPDILHTSNMEPVSLGK